MIISQKLFHAVEKGDLDTIRSELARGVDVDVKDQFGEPTLHIAAKYNFKAMEMLLKHGASVDVQVMDGYTALHIATEHGNVEAMEMLLKHGASVDVQDMDGYTALHIATEHDNVEAMEILLKHGASVDVQDINSYTALHTAVKHANVEAIEILLQYGANVNIKNNFDSTALHIAIEYDNVEAMEMLLKHGASIDVQDMDGYTALHIAVDNHNVQATSILLEYGADATLKNCDSESPFSGLMNSRLFDTEFIDKLIAIHTERIFYIKPEDYDFDQLHFGEDESQDYINRGVVARYNSLRILEELKQVDAIYIKQKAEMALNDIPANVRQDLVASYERHNEMFIEKLIYDPIIKKFSQHKLLEIKLLPFIVELSGITRGAINDIDIRKCLVGIQNPQEVFDQDLIGEDMQDQDAF